MVKKKYEVILGMLNSERLTYFSQVISQANRRCKYLMVVSGGGDGELLEETRKGGEVEQTLTNS